MRAWRDLGRLPRELWALALASFVNRLGSMVLPFLTLYITKGLGYSAARGGIGLAIWGGAALCMGPLAGRIADRFGAARTMKWSLAVSGAVVAAIPFARSWYALLALIVAASVTTESFRPANLSLIAGHSPEGLLKQSFALNRMAINLGMSVGPAVGGLLATRSFASLFWVDGATSILAALVVALSSIRDSGKPHDREAHAASSSPLRDPSMLRFLFAILPVLIVFWQYEASMPVYLVRDLHFSEAFYGALFTLNTLLIVACEVPLNSAMARWPHRRSLALGSMLFAAGFGALAFAKSYAAVGATVIVWTFGEMTLFPSMSAHVSELASEARRGEYMSYYLMAFSATLMVGPWIGLTLLDQAGPLVLWPTMFALGAISGVLLSRRPRAALS